MEFGSRHEKQKISRTWLEDIQWTIMIMLNFFGSTIISLSCDFR